jgi:hypothetical protein
MQPILKNLGIKEWYYAKCLYKNIRVPNECLRFRAYGRTSWGKWL